MADWTLVGHMWRPNYDFRRSSRTFVDGSRLIWPQLAHLIDMTNLTPNRLEDMLTTSELADYLKVTRQVIYDLRHDGRGPRGIHVGKELRYRVSDITAWLELRSDPVGEGALDAR